jgi:hypothetical protein
VSRDPFFSTRRDNLPSQRRPTPLAQSGLSAMSAYLSAFGAKRTCGGSG